MYAYSVFVVLYQEFTVGEYKICPGARGHYIRLKPGALAEKLLVTIAVKFAFLYENSVYFQNLLKCQSVCRTKSLACS